ncbi:MAG: DNA polymerase IV [Planctomycetaceae bacterium]|nr:DNA polymerase IV [Planctomycetaceae bacterium]
MILHIDMDAFYASVEERERPELVGKPVIVGGLPAGRGVVAAANYEVRKYGVRSAMPTATALRLCPHAIVIPPRIAFYAEVSAEIRAIFERYTPLVEPLSLDEAFLNVAGSEVLFGPARDIAQQIKQEIWQSLRLVASVGVAPNKFVAKIASDLHKPDALVVVMPDEVQAFLDPLPVSRLWGAGPAAQQRFAGMRIETIREVRELSPEKLTELFGKTGERYWELARGIDRRPVVPDREAKSISHETTFATDIGDHDVLRGWLLDLAEQVTCRLRRQGISGRRVQLKLRFSDFHTITRARTLPAPSHLTQEVGRTAVELLEEGLATSRLPVRLVGVSMSGLEPARERQKSLFGDEERERASRLDAMRDQIRQRFGAAGLQRASGLRPAKGEDADGLP